MKYYVSNMLLDRKGRLKQCEHKEDGWFITSDSENEESYFEECDYDKVLEMEPGLEKIKDYSIGSTFVLKREYDDKYLEDTQSKTIIDIPDCTGWFR